jgi:hypothetical protein
MMHRRINSRGLTFAPHPRPCYRAGFSLSNNDPSYHGSEATFGAFGSIRLTPSAGVANVPNQRMRGRAL